MNIVRGTSLHIIFAEYTTYLKFGLSPLPIILSNYFQHYLKLSLPNTFKRSRKKNPQISVVNSPFFQKAKLCQLKWPYTQSKEFIINSLMIMIANLPHHLMFFFQFGANIQKV